ncbi:hypothetical protein QMK33_18140 [Hymenobacter sp. H14-R3]|uniref:hypothetical protein n=1 Tax=Hymenobacter sp. H14-R3 TaxID=3046308 RepID=UPI0024BB5473|nr:hypothetical protein [Hymenobacter sp. H14-R3]MDJ0367074.1 hypothetical protein [Hymenobacter sp. H14-R3]
MLPTAFSAPFLTADGAKPGLQGRLFFYPARNGHARNPGCPHDAALRIALFQQLIHLRILGGFGHGRGLEASLVAARFALVAGVPLAMAIAPNLVAATFGAKMLCVNHNSSYGFHPYLDHRRLLKLLKFNS